MDESDETSRDSYHGKELPPPKKRPGRKKVAKRSKVKRSRERGKYGGKSGCDQIELDADLADCIFSDEEMRQEYVGHVPVDDTESIYSSENSKAETSGKDASVVLPGSSSSSIVESDLSRPSSSVSSRPASSLSRPTSSLSRPPSTLESRPPQEAGDDSDENLECEPCEAVCEPSMELIEQGMSTFKSLLPKSWVPIADREGFHLLLVSSKSPMAIQREIFISYNGNVQVLIHCKPVPNFKEIFNLSSEPLLQFIESGVDAYCNFGLSIVKTFINFEACVGANELETKALWDKIGGTYIDSNPYQEDRFSETCRSLSCLRIVELGKGKRCSECTKVLRNISRRKDFLLSPDADPASNNRYLTLDKALKKLEQQQQEIRKKDKKIAWLQSRINGLLESEGVNIEEDLNESFSRIILSSDKLTDVQKMFLQEQWSSFNKADSRVHRWHPSMIRLALHLHMNSSASYEALRDLGVIRLPHSRTLFDYSHSIKAKEGVNEGLVNLVYKRIEELNEPCKQFHVLLCDGMHVSHNLVFRVSDGDLVGYANLNSIDKEMERLESYVDGKDPISKEPQLATEVLAFMVKGMASDVKCVIASYPMKVLTKEMLYKRSWEVIQHLETAGIKILAFVCDGHPVNRAFFNMHVPCTTDTKFGAVFDTFNFCAPDERPIFFVSDVCHLIKTLRNAFYNSGEGPKKPRHLEINGEKIEWKSIVRLYLTFKNNTFRKSFKLNAQNVFPTSYSKMKVRHAAQVLSETVAQDLAEQNWSGTGETIKFIRWCNRFFDVLNGAHSFQSKRHNKPDLAPYTCANLAFDLEEGRFKFLKDFLNYLVDWKNQVSRLPLAADVKERMILPIQTLIGIETSIRAIEGATIFFLDPLKGKGNFVNARIFSQDPLEQHFSRQRCGGGGSRNPNVSQFQQKQVSTALQRGLNIKKRKGNSTGEVGMQLTTEPVPKMKYKKRNL